MGNEAEDVHKLIETHKNPTQESRELHMADINIDA